MMAIQLPLMNCYHSQGVDDEQERKINYFLNAELVL
jgi:hypothetical protein